MSDNKKGKAKSQNLPRRQRKSKTKKASMPGKRRMKASSAVVARNTTTHDPVSFSEGPIMSARNGRGQRFIGTQVLQSVVLTASDSQFWTGTAPAVAASINSIFLNPDILNGRLAVFANTYAKYAFRRVVLEYEPYVATSQAGAACLAMINDPAQTATAQPTYVLAQDIVPSVTFALRDRASLTYTYSGDDLFWTEYDPTSNSSIRQTCQASIWGFPSASSIGAMTAGIIKIHYVIDMYSPTNTLGIVFSGLSKVQKEMVKEYADHLRSTKSTVKDDLSKVPVEKSTGITAPSSSSSSSTLSSGTVSSGWFRV